MDNKKKLTIILAIFALVGVFAVLVFSGFFDNIIKPAEEETTESDFLSLVDDYSTAVLATASNNLPYLATDIDDVFYTMSTTGEVKFYSYQDNTFFPLEATGTYDVSVKLSEQKLSATVTYYEKDDVISGYGLYTGSTTEFDLYPYAFFRLTNFGENYSKAKPSTCLLLVDTTDADFYSNDKIFEEPFVFNLNDGSCTRQLSEANRTVGLSGAKRSDYCLINDTVIDGSTEQMLFFSGRQYAEDDTRVDLLRSGGSGNNTDNVKVAKEVIGYWARYTDEGIKYITTNENNEVTIELYNTDNKETTVIKTLDGILYNNIIIDDDYIYIRKTNTVYDILNDKEIKITFSGSESFNADLFEYENDKVIIRGYADERYPVLVIAELSTAAVKAVYSDELFRGVVNPVFSGDSAIVTVQKDGQFSYYVF